MREVRLGILDAFGAKVGSAVLYLETNARPDEHPDSAPGREAEYAIPREARLIIPPPVKERERAPWSLTIELGD